MPCDRRLARALLIALLVTGRASAATAATFTVNSAADTTDGSCDPLPGGCTLREAIEAAVATPGRDTIAFDATVFPKGSPLVQIAVTTPLPPIADPAGTVVDGAGAGVQINGNGSVPEGLVFASAPGMPLVKVTVANVIVAGFTGTAVHVCGGVPQSCGEDVANTLVRNVVVDGTNDGDGIRIEGRVNSKARVLDSVAFHIGGTGIRLFATQSLVGARVQGATVRDCDQGGILLRATGDVTGASVLDTVAVENRELGVGVSAPTIVKPKIANVVAHDDDVVGIVVEGDDAPPDTLTGASIAQSTASKNSVAGIAFEGAFASSAVSLAGVVANGNESSGVLFAGPTIGVTIKGAVALDNFTNGLMIAADGSGVAISGTTAADNRGNGLYLRTFASTVQQTRASANDADGIVLAPPTGNKSGAPGTTITESATAANGAAGIDVAENSVMSAVEKNVALGNASDDLHDGNASCDADTWSANTFRTSNASCVH